MEHNHSNNERKNSNSYVSPKKNLAKTRKKMATADFWNGNGDAAFFSSSSAGAAASAISIANSSTKKTPSKDLVAFIEHLKGDQEVFAAVYTQIGQFWCKRALNKRSVECLKSIKAHYDSHPEKIGELLAPIAKNCYSISSRTFEYACVNYAQKKNVFYSWRINGEDVVVHVADMYTRWLTQWNRRNFDFFRRYDRVFFNYDGQIHETSVGQVHIMYWADTYGVVDFVKRHLSDITSDMSLTHSRNRRDKQKYKIAGIKRKRRKLVVHSKNKCSIYAMNVVINFNEHDFPQPKLQSSQSQSFENACANTSVDSNVDSNVNSSVDSSASENF